MISFNPDMQNEKLAAILLVIVIVGSISVFLTVTYGEDILNTLTGKKTGEKIIALGDCANINFIGRYASNNTIFDSSYNDTTTKTGGTPLNVFVTLNQTESSPAGYDTYSSGYIEGMIEGLVGLKEGQTSVINIPPEKAYGAKKLKVGDTFSTKYLTYSDLNYQLNQTVEVTDLADESITLKWLNVQDLGNFTLPEAVLMGPEDIVQATYSPYDTLPPYYIWENSSTIINVTDTNVLIKTTPTKTQNLTKQVTIFGIADKFGFIFPDATTAEWNESKITLQSSPIPGSKYELDYGGMLFNITANNVTTTHVNVSIEFEGNIQYYDLNRTIEFNRTYSMSRIYEIPLTYFQYLFGEDIQNAGYGLNELAGEQLLFEVTILKVYKIS
jgi:FKBP-type peptidyl-prolyl cis-trans isomerase 2